MSLAFALITETHAREGEGAHQGKIGLGPEKGKSASKIKKADKSSLRITDVNSWCQKQKTLITGRSGRIAGLR